MLAWKVAVDKNSTTVVANDNALKSLGSLNSSRHKIDMAWDAHQYAK
jgi:hypothetical protein